MNLTGMGDIAQGHMLRQRTTGLKTEIDRLTGELTSGQVSNVRDTLRGNFSFLTDVERQSVVLEGYGVATTEAAHFTTAMQLSLTQFADMAQKLSGSLMSAGTSGNGANTIDISLDARATLESMVGALNTKIAGRAMFSGSATDTQPLADADTIMADLAVAIAGAATPADMVTQAQAWFDDPAGFAASAYQGAGTAMSGFAVSSEETVDLDLRATEPRLTRAMANAAVAALATDPGFGLDAVGQAELYALAGQDMIANMDGITALQTRVGFAEAQIDRATTRNAASLSSLTMAKNILLSADPFETATKLEEAQFQLQSLYSVTVRMSQLSLVNFL